jgi:hypothetical protein
MFVPAKVAEQHKARELRALGKPYRQIAAALGVSVSSVLAWTRDIQLTAAQAEANLRGPRGPLNPDAVRRRSAGRVAAARARRLAFQEEGRAAARRGDPLHQAGCMLYWAEGAKSRGTIKFTNSDSHMVVLFRRFLTDALNVEAEKVLMSLNVYTNNGLTIDAIERRWLDLLALPRRSLRKHTLNHRPTSSSGRAANRLPYGVCTLVVHSTALTQHIYGAIQEYGGFEETTWLR